MKKQLFFLALCISPLFVNAQNINLYGVTFSGGTGNAGTIFNIVNTSSGFNSDYSFSIQPGFPTDNVIQATNGLLYGTTETGGANNDGIIFSYNTSTGVETDVHDFGSDGDGQSPYGSLVQASDGLLYGMTNIGGTNGQGVIYSFNTSTGEETVLYNFGTVNKDGARPVGSLIQASDGLLYGMAPYGGTNDTINDRGGMIFSYNISTTIYTVVHDFGKDSDGEFPSGSLIQAKNGLLYGTTLYGGANDSTSFGYGTIFSYNISTGTDIVVHRFTNAVDGGQPQGSLLQAGNGVLYGLTTSGGTNSQGVIFSYNISTATETVLHNFGTGTDGLFAPGNLIQATDSLLYGMTAGGGVDSDGTIFSYNITSSVEQVLYSFKGGKDGIAPQGSLCQASNGLLYGLTYNGGIKDQGLFFSYNILSDTEIVADDFGSMKNGYFPYGKLIKATNGLLYGGAAMGGVYNKGIIFSYNMTTGEETDVYDFGNGTDGYGLFSGSLIQLGDSLLYGLNVDGGTNDYGTIFSYNIYTGKETVLYDFAGSSTDGQNPYGALVQANNGLLYGTTGAGGAYQEGTIFSYDISTGKETDLYNFGNGTDGKSPAGSLIQATDGLLYGMTSGGGTQDEPVGFGTIFSYDISTGVEKDIHDFGMDTDGQYPNGSLLQASNGLLYGVTPNGGGNSYGIIFDYNISTGEETLLYDFTYDIDAENPSGTLIQAKDGKLYGSTTGGDGTVYSYDIFTNTKSSLHYFGIDDGLSPGDLLEVDTTTGINQLSVNSEQLKIYPNPTSNQLTVESGQVTVNQITITNVLGQTMLRAAFPPSPLLGGEAPGVRFDVSTLPDGLYFITATTDSGTVTKKFVINK